MQYHDAAASCEINKNIDFKKFLNVSRRLIKKKNVSRRYCFFNVSRRYSFLFKSQNASFLVKQLSFYSELQSTHFSHLGPWIL